MKAFKYANKDNITIINITFHHSFIVSAREDKHSIAILQKKSKMWLNNKCFLKLK